MPHRSSAPQSVSSRGSLPPLKPRGTKNKATRPHRKVTEGGPENCASIVEEVDEWERAMLLLHPQPQPANVAAVPTPPRTPPRVTPRFCPFQKALKISSPGGPNKNTSSIQLSHEETVCARDAKKVALPENPQSIQWDRAAWLKARPTLHVVRKNIKPPVCDSEPASLVL